MLLDSKPLPERADGVVVVETSCGFGRLGKSEKSARNSSQRGLRHAQGSSWSATADSARQTSHVVDDAIWSLMSCLRRAVAIEGRWCGQELAASWRWPGLLPRSFAPSSLITGPPQVSRPVLPEDGAAPLQVSHAMRFLGWRAKNSASSVCRAGVCSARNATWRCGRAIGVMDQGLEFVIVGPKVFRLESKLNRTTGRGGARAGSWCFVIASLSRLAQGSLHGIPFCHSLTYSRNVHFR